MGGGNGGTSHNSDGDGNVLNANRNDDGRRVDADYVKPGNQWYDGGAFAFLVPATLFISPSSFDGGVLFFYLPIGVGSHVV